MKKFFLFAIAGLLSAMGVCAQVTVAEPDFAEETLLLTSDNSGKLLNRENATVKTKAGASLYLTGIGKVKSRLTLPGKTSTSKLKAGKDARLVIRAKDNETDPNSFINIFRFDVKGKERRYQLAESGTLSKTEVNSLSNIEYQAKRYGKKSYLILLNDLEPGEYGIVFGDPNNVTGKNGLKVTTFTVAEE